MLKCRNIAKRRKESLFMGIFVPYLMCAVFLAAMFGLMRLCLYFSNLSARRRILKSHTQTAKTTHALLLSYFGGKNLISGKYLPERTAYGTAYKKYDHILISNDKLTVITVREEDGKIENLSSTESWHHTKYSRYGTESKVAFENPIKAANERAKALTALLEKAGCDFKIPVESVVIFPSRRIKFSVPRQKEIMSPPEALRNLGLSSKGKPFTKEEKKTIRRVIRHYSKSASYAAAKNRKLRHR